MTGQGASASALDSCCVTLQLMKRGGRRMGKEEEEEEEEGSGETGAVNPVVVYEGRTEWMNESDGKKEGRKEVENGQNPVRSLAGWQWQYVQPMFESGGNCRCVQQKCTFNIFSIINFNNDQSPLWLHQLTSDPNKSRALPPHDKLISVGGGSMARVCQASEATRRWSVGARLKLLFNSRLELCRLGLQSIHNYGCLATSSSNCDYQFLLMRNWHSTTLNSEDGRSEQEGRKSAD